MDAKQMKKNGVHRSAEKKTTTYALRPPGKLMSTYCLNSFQDSC
jgi:hypothetical protein